MFRVDSGLSPPSTGFWWVVSCRVRSPDLGSSELRCECPRTPDWSGHSGDWEVTDSLTRGRTLVDGGPGGSYGQDPSFRLPPGPPPRPEPDR